MKKILTLVLIVSSFMAYSQTVLDATMNQSGLIELNNLESINSFSVNGQVELKSPNALLRIVLEFVDGRELLVYETNSLLANSSTFAFSNACEETYEFSEGIPSKLKMDIVDAELSLKSYNTAYSSNKKFLSTEESLKTKISKINANLRKQGALWVAGETPYSKMTYAEKKKLLGADILSKIQGIEYYKGGIIDMKMYSNNLKNSASDPVSEQYVPWADEFSYVSLHGADDPNSPYFNNKPDEDGWITSVKDQGPAGACWAFAAVASLEARANLYFNQHLSMDLSEQDLISCSGQGTAADGGWAELGMQWASIYGLVNEEAFPYYGNDTTALALDNSKITERIITQGVAFYTYHSYIASEGGIKRMLINKGPMALNYNAWRHAMLLVGYKTLSIGTQIELPINGNIQNGFETITIDASSPYLGKTIWRIKNSWGKQWGENGYFYMIVDDWEQLYRSAVATGTFESMRYNESDIKCYDKDGDGYYNWGIGERPAHCPSDGLADGDDSNPLYGPRDDYGNLTLIGALANVQIVGNDILGAASNYSLSGLPAGATLVRWSSSVNTESDNYNETDFNVRVKSNNGLASITAHFTYSGAEYKITKTVSTSENQIVFAEKKTNLPPATGANYIVADFDMDGDYDLVFSGETKYDYQKIVSGDVSSLNMSRLYFENNNAFLRDTSLMKYSKTVWSSQDIMLCTDLNNDFAPDLTVVNDGTKKIFYQKEGTLDKDIKDLPTHNWQFYGSHYYKLQDFNNDGEKKMYMFDASWTPERGDYAPFLEGSLVENSINTIFKADNLLGRPPFVIADFDNDGINDIVSMSLRIYYPGFDYVSPDATSSDAFLSYYKLNKATNEYELSSKSSFDYSASNIPVDLSLLDIQTADFNNDGFMDVLVEFSHPYNTTAFGGMLYVFLNEGGQGFTSHPIRISSENTMGLYTPNVTIGDFNNDNFADMLYSGFTSYDRNIRRLYLLTNDGSGHFDSKSLNVPGTSVQYGNCLIPADFNNDNKLDFLISGEDGIYLSCAGGKTEIMLNSSSIPEMSAPVAPSNLTLIDTIVGQYIFNWDKLSEGGYSYNIKIGTTPGGGEIISCDALMNGKLTIPKMGHVGLAGKYILNKELPYGTYYWTVQAIDNAYRGGAFAAVQTFTIEKTNESPTIEAQTFSIDENLVNGSIVGTVLASDGDADALTYSISAGNSTNTFSIDGSTGEISVNDNTALDYETNSSLVLTVDVSDGVLNSNANITINLTNVNESPTIESQTFSIDENLANDSPVGTVQASDVDADVLTYSISAGNSTNTFSIDGSTGEISVNDNTALDYETNSSLGLTVDVSDGVLNSNANITINLTNVNESPTIESQTFSIDENLANASPVGTVQASDVDADVLTYSISAGNSTNTFSIDGSTGEISVNDNTALDYETNSSLILTVDVSDGVLNSNANITINLTNVNESPTIEAQTFSIEENLANGSIVGTVQASDVDSDALSYSISAGNSTNTFSIDNSTGEISVNDNTALDYETNLSFTLTVDVSDGVLNSNANITINLTNANESPIIEAQSFTIEENLANGSVVGTVQASDVDADALTYSISAGNSTNTFSIDNSTGEISVNDNTALDYETNLSFTLTVEVSDGVLSSNANITINLTNVNESPTIEAQSFSIEENLANGSIVGTVQASDMDADALTYSISAGNSTNTFSIDGSTGEITVNDNTALDYETNSSFTLTVAASDGVLSSNAEITISLTNANESPIIEAQSFTIEENLANGSIVGTVQASDVDADALTYSISAGNSTNTFSIDGSTGEISVNDNTVLDYETNSSLILTVDVSDGVLSSNANITINLTNVNESPTIEAQSFSIEENLANGSIVGTVQASDMDADVLTYSISAGNSTNTFSIDGSTGEISVNDNTALDYETNSLFILTVAVSDGVLSNSAEMTINITDNVETSTSEDVVNTIIMRPNPASEFVLFDTGMKSNIWVDIFNIQGQIVISQNLSDNNKVLVNGLKNGLYTCRIIEDGKISIQKLLIRK